MQLLVIVKVGGLSIPRKYCLHLSNFIQELPSKFDIISTLAVTFGVGLSTQLISILAMYIN